MSMRVLAELMLCCCVILYCIGLLAVYGFLLFLCSISFYVFKDLVEVIVNYRHVEYDEGGED